VFVRARACVGQDEFLFHVEFWRGLLFHPEDEGDMFLEM
jgi:hypothetical protein